MCFEIVQVLNWSATPQVYRCRWDMRAPHRLRVLSLKPAMGRPAKALLERPGGPHQLLYSNDHALWAREVFARVVLKPAWRIHSAHSATV